MKTIKTSTIMTTLGWGTFYLGLLAAASSPYWYTKYQNHQASVVTSEDLSQQRDALISTPETKPCVGTTHDYPTWHLDRKLTESAQAADTVITASTLVAGNCVDEVGEHYLDRGFVVLVGNRTYNDGSKEVKVVVKSDFTPKDTE
jgi:hypothetical protein